MDNFYEHIDIVFDNLYEKFGLTDELIKYKNDILVAYENKKPYHNTHLKAKKHFHIDENGYIRSL